MSGVATRSVRGRVVIVDKGMVPVGESVVRVEIAQEDAMNALAWLPSIGVESEVVLSHAKVGEAGRGRAHGERLGAWWDAELEKQRAKRRAVVEAKPADEPVFAYDYDPLTVLWPTEKFSR